MSAKTKYITKSEKDYKRDINTAFLQGSEKTLVIMLNAVVDELWKRKVALDEDDIKAIADTFNRYCTHFERDALKTTDFIENFEKWTGMRFDWMGTPEGNIKPLNGRLRAVILKECRRYDNTMQRMYRQDGRTELSYRLRAVCGI